MAINLRQMSLGLLLALFVQQSDGLRYLTLPAWMSVISAKNATPILQGNGKRPVDCIILALEKNLKPSFFFFEPAKSRCALYAAMQGYTMYGYAGRSYFILGDDFYKGPSGVCPPLNTLIYGMMNLAYGTHRCLQNPTPFKPASDGTTRCSLTSKKRPAIGAYYAGCIGNNKVSPEVSPYTFNSLSRNQTNDALRVNCDSPVASVTYMDSKPFKPSCYAFFTYPKGTSAQAACNRKFPGSVVEWNAPRRPDSANFGYWGNFPYWAYLPDPGSKTADYVFYEDTGPETDIVNYPVTGCVKWNVTQSKP